MDVPKRLHWGHYAIEAWGLGTFMIVAGAVAVALDMLPVPIARWLAVHDVAGRAIFGVAMGLCAAAIIYSPWGARSGAHLNPAVTLTFACLRKLEAVDALGYAVAQFAGGALGFAIVALLAGSALVGPPSNAIVTKPGPDGPAAAFLGEALISFVLMTVVLIVSNAPPRIARLTGVAAGALVAAFITIEAPLSGTSMNPARTLASALQGHDYSAIWIYFTAPPLGMLVAAVAFVRVRGLRAVACGRLNHAGHQQCIFRCGYSSQTAQR
jgi:aquaporin Z